MISDVVALARTALFIRLDVFGGLADESAIVAGLRRTTVRIVSDGENSGTESAQTLITTLAGLTAMLGLRVQLAFPDVELAGRQPPLKGSRLHAGIAEWLDDLIPPSSRDGSNAPPDIVFVVGDTPYAGARAFRLVGSDWGGAVQTLSGGLANRWDASWPFGALAVAAAAAAEAFRAGLQFVGDEVGRALPRPAQWHLDFDRPVVVDLRFPGESEPTADLGLFDFVSGGAISTAALYSLLRLPDVSGGSRVFEPDVFGATNLNRYPLMRRSQCGQRKADLLASWSTPEFRLQPEPVLYKADGPDLAHRVLVGVDRIRARWDVQANSAGWVCVGATTHDFVIVSTHTTSSPCAGCAHPRDDDSQDDIPTLSFVSFWAGLMQARALVACAAGMEAGGDAIYAWPMSLFAPRGIHRVGVAPHPHCPVACDASHQLEPTA